MIATALPGDWLGYIAATLTTVAFVPQVVRTLRTRDTRALSLVMYLVFTVGIAFWLGYGLVLGSWPIILSNSLTLVLAGIILVLKLRHG
ncbi:MAG TPA: SemiSWEET transporter [Rhodanobacteraceae bacterium]|nr:SemiSWEET transporter [Rhodanobacteraceae bacterium]